MELQQQVAHAVHILNHDTQSCNRVAANQWLVQFQHTDAAWEVATTILATDSSHTHDFEVELFAAQVLKRKVRVSDPLSGKAEKQGGCSLPVKWSTNYVRVYNIHPHILSLCPFGGVQW